MCQLKHHEYEQRETRMDEFIVHDARVVLSNIARFRQEQRRLKAQGGRSTTAGIAAAAGAIDADDDDAAGDLDSDEADGGLGAAAAAETCANCGIDGNDDDDGNSGAFGQLGITEATDGSGGGRKMTVEEAAVYRSALAASASSRALGSGPSPSPKGMPPRSSLASSPVQGGLGTTTGIAAAASAIDADDDDAAGDLDSDEADGGLGAAAAAETCANCGIDGNDDDDGNSGAFGQLGITEATDGSGGGRKMTVEEAAVYRSALAASASSRALGSGPSPSPMGMPPRSSLASSPVPAGSGASASGPASPPTGVPPRRSLAGSSASAGSAVHSAGPAPPLGVPPNPPLAGSSASAGSGARGSGPAPPPSSAFAGSGARGSGLAPPSPLSSPAAAAAAAAAAPSSVLMRALSDQAAERSAAAPAVACEPSRRPPPPPGAIRVAQTNPKLPGHPPHARYEKYKMATTKQQYHDLGGTKRDWRYDVSRGFVVVASDQREGTDASSDGGFLGSAPSATGSVGAAAASPLSPKSQELVARAMLTIQRSKDDREAGTFGAAAMPAQSALGSNESNSDPRDVWEVSDVRRVSEATCAAADSLAAVIKRHPMSNDLISKRLVYFAFSGPAPLLAPSYRQRFATPRSVNRLLQKITDLPAECAHVVCIWCRKVASGELVYHAKEPRPRSGAARM